MCYLRTGCLGVVFIIFIFFHFILIMFSILVGHFAAVKKVSMYSCQAYSSFVMGSHSFRIACLLERPFGSILVKALAKLLLRRSWGLQFSGLFDPGIRKNLG
jgi:hypothetical protein